jgi:GT2 family glycosyltransferase
MIYIGIPVFNRISYTRKCLQSIRLQTYSEYTVVICDDGSTDNTAEVITTEFPEVILLKGDGNLWWTGGINECVKYALDKAKDNDFIFTLNNDTELAVDTLQTLIEFSESHPKSLLACGNYFIDEKNKLESTAFVKKEKSPFSKYHKPLFGWGETVENLKEDVYEVDSVSGKGVLIPISVFHITGTYNSEKLPHYHADTEFTRRASLAGYKIFLLVKAVVFTDPNTSGIGQVNSKVSISEFFKSLFSIRSENHLRSQYNRSKLIYGKKWIVYLIPNLVSIFCKFFTRYVASSRNK